MISNLETSKASWILSPVWKQSKNHGWPSAWENPLLQTISQNSQNVFPLRGEREDSHGAEEAGCHSSGSLCVASASLGHDRRLWEIHELSVGSVHQASLGRGHGYQHRDTPAGSEGNTDTCVCWSASLISVVELWYQLERILGKHEKVKRLFTKICICYPREIVVLKINKRIPNQPTKII